jgi:GTPase SAR1 family protein
MDGFGSRKETITRVNTDLLALFEAAKSIGGLGDYSFGEWEKACAELPAQLAEETLRVAVVGAIKSGKSTFLNSLLGGDVLKRGAGVVTSIVTRVRAGERLSATLFFKSWAEVNADMEQALILFPAVQWRSGEERFDIRRARLRGELGRALNELHADQRISEDARNRNMVLLGCYLQGYDTILPLLKDHQVTQLYEGERFVDHWDYTGNESLAVYLRDILLNVNAEPIGSNIEIADCQGSDSSNPLHLAMIQDYLRLAHLLVYVISSRTGLRRADIKFLSMIKKMGILENTLFVLNCDFSEHQSIDDFKRLIARVREEVGMIQPEPRLFSFSALFNLLRSIAGTISEKDGRRLESWQADTDFVAFSDSETARFSTAFRNLLERKRHRLFFQNHIERLRAIASGMTHWTGVGREILSRNSADARKIAGRIEAHRQRFEQIQSVFQSSLGGILPDLKKGLGSEVNRYLDPGSGEVVRRLERFISEYRFRPEDLSDSLPAAGFSQALYQAFQEFKQALDGFITEQVNPDIMRFTAAQETTIRKAMEAVAAPYQGLIEEAHGEFCSLIEDLGIAVDCSRPETQGLPGVESLLRGSGLEQPPLSGSLNYSARIRTEGVLRLGLYRLLTGVKKAMKKRVVSGEDALRAMKQVMNRIKRETRQSLVFNLTDYQENLKFGYLYRMADTVARRLSEAVSEQLRAYAADFGVLAGKLNAKREDKQRAVAVLAEMETRCRELGERIEQLQQDLGAALGTP